MKNKVWANCQAAKADTNERIFTLVYDIISLSLSGLIAAVVTCIPEALHYSIVQTKVWN